MPYNDDKDVNPNVRYLENIIAPIVGGGVGLAADCYIGGDGGGGLVGGALAGFVISASRDHTRSFSKYIVRKLKPKRKRSGGYYKKY